MTKNDFLAQLRKGLSGLPQDDIEQRVIFYSEMIEDRMEEDLPEEDAVAAIGPVEDIIAQAITDTPLCKIVTHKIKPKRQLNALEIALIVLGFPIWFSLGIAAVAVIFSAYVSIWSVIISFWAVFAALTGCALGTILAGIGLAFNTNTFPGIAMISAGIICAGLSIFMFFGCKAATKGIASLTKKFALFLKNCFIKKEVIQ